MASLSPLHKPPATLLLLLLSCLCCVFGPVRAAEEVVLNVGNLVREARFTVPETITILNDTNFDALVSSAAGPSSRAWFLFVYSPWCDLCKGVLPHFLDAGVGLAADGARRPHARMALLDAHANRAVRGRLGVRHYPTLLYTAGGPAGWAEFRGEPTPAGLRGFARALQAGLDDGVFAADLTDAARFAAAAREDGRVPFYVLARGGREARGEEDVVSEAAFGLANVRFGVIFEREMAADWRERGGPAYVAVVEAARACREAGQASGPDGKVLVHVSDRFRRPRCYAGPWLDPPASPDTPPQISALLKQYIIVNGFRAVEELTGSLLDTVEAQKMGLLGIVFTDGGLAQDDPNYIPVLREIVQKFNDELEAKRLPLQEELNAPRVTWTQINGPVYDQWLRRYKVAPEELPAFLIVDPIRTRLYRVRTRVPELEAIKLQTPWQIGGPQQRMLEQFIRDVIAGKYYGEKLSAAAALAERLSYVPGLGWIYRLLRYDDFVFVFVMSSLGFFAFLLLMALVVDPIATKLLDRPKKMKID